MKISYLKQINFHQTTFYVLLQIFVYVKKSSFESLEVFVQTLNSTHRKSCSLCGELGEQTLTLEDREVSVFF